MLVTELAYELACLLEGTECSELSKSPPLTLDGVFFEILHEKIVSISTVIGNGLVELQVIRLEVDQENLSEVFNLDESSLSNHWRKSHHRQGARLVRREIGNDLWAPTDRDIRKLIQEPID